MTDGRVCCNLSSEQISVIIARIHQVISLSLTVLLISAWCFQFVTETKPVLAVIIAFFGWFFASTIFIDAVKTRKANQTIYFILTSVILFVLCFAYLVLFIFILADEKSTDGIPYFIPSPILVIFQFYTFYISMGVPYMEATGSR